MISIFRYPGGKTKKSVQNTILRYAPEEIREYREPFVGGGGIFFALDGKSNFNGLVREEPEVRWINDSNQDLVEVYLALRDRAEEFIAKCKDIKPMQKGEPVAYPTENSSGKQYNARLMKKFKELIADKSDRAFSYYFVNRTVWGGRVNYDMPSRLYFSNPEGWNIVSTNRLERAAQHIAGAKITCGDFEPLLKAKGEGVWIYCDPPYVRDTNLAAPSKLYQMGFSMEDHERLRDCVLESPHQVCLSYDEDEDGAVRDLYSDSRFNIYSKQWTYCGTSSADGASKTKTRGKELVITNYKPPKIKKTPKIF